MNIKIADKIRELLEKANYTEERLAKDLGLEKDKFKKLLDTDSIPSEMLFRIVKIINTSILYFYPTDKDIFTDIVEKWRYNEKESPYTSIPLVEDIYPDNLLRTLFTSQTSVMVPFNCIKYYDSILAVRIKKINFKDSNIFKESIVVVNFSFVRIKDSELVIFYDKEGTFYIRNFYKERLYSFDPDIKAISAEDVTIFGKIVYFQMDDLILL